MGKDKHRTIENIGESIGASCQEVVPDPRPDLGAEHSGNPPIVGCQECYKNSALFTQFFLIFLTYGLLSYSVRLHCANIHTPLPSSFLSLQFSDHEDKASRSILLKGDI